MGANRKGVSQAEINLCRIQMTPYLPLRGEISRKRRRKWKRQVLRANPGLNPEWLDARYEILTLPNLTSVVTFEL